MARDTSTDGITLTLIEAYVPILSLLSGWGVLSSGSKSIYPCLSLPMPQEPFPAAYIYLGGQTHNFQQGTGLRQDFNTVTIRLIGGPVTPNYLYNAERKVYSLLTGIVNELTYRRFLEDPTNNDAPFRYVMPEEKLSVGSIGRIITFNYGEQGNFTGIEIPTSIGLEIKVGRLS